MSADADVRVVHLPAPTAWPVVLALGITLMAGGLVTDVAVSALGLSLSVCAAVGWCRSVLPVEAVDMVRIEARTPAARPRPRRVARVHAASDVTRATLPLEIYPVSAGIKGGLAGAVVMALLAMTYGIVSRTSIWYPINLLAAGFSAEAAHQSTADLAAFHLRSLLLASVIHSVASILVGMLYGAMLPMIPRRPMLLGGLVTPVIWTGLLHGILGVVNPVMNARIDWGWFAVSQVGFGIAAGFVVSRQQRVWTAQPVPLAVRAGIEAPGLMRERRGGES